MKIDTAKGPLEVDYFVIEWPGVHMRRPYSSGVYLLFDQGEVIYVGSSFNIPHRLSRHRCGAGTTVKKAFQRVAIIEVAGLNTALEIERELIKKYKPKYNSTRYTGKPSDRCNGTLPIGWKALHSDPNNRRIPMKVDMRIVHAPRLGVKPPHYLPHPIGSMCDKWGWSDDDALATDIASEVTCTNCLRVIEKENRRAAA